MYDMSMECTDYIAVDETSGIVKGLKGAAIINRLSRITAEIYTIRLIHKNGVAYVAGSASALAWIVLRNPLAAVWSLVYYEGSHAPNFPRKRAVGIIKTVPHGSGFKY